MGIERELAYLITEAYSQYSRNKNGRDFVLADGWLNIGNFFADHVPWGFVAVKSDVMVVSIRGTDAWSDWLIDGEIVPNTLGIHKGFYELFTKLNGQIQNILWHQFNPRLFKLYFTGHSAGAPIAVQSAHDSGLPCQVITFASPMFVTDDCSKFNTLEHTRIYNPLDKVPKLPIFPDYVHIGKPLPTSEFGNDPISEHSINNYMECFS